MLQLAKSVLRLPWAASVFGAQQVANLLSPNGIRKAEGAFYSVTVAAQEQFATSPLFFAGFQFGDEAQRAAVDLFFDGLDLRILRPEWIDHTIGSIARQAVATGRALLPGDNLRLYIDSLRNALTVVNLVNRSFSLLALPPGPIDLRNAIEKSYSFGEYEPLWLVEGLGEAYANQNWLDAAPVHGLLSTGQGAHLPEKSLLMMHAGMGISFAKHLIRPLTPVTPKAEIDTALRRFLTLVRANSRPGYEGPAFESLGLVARTWYKAMVPLIDESLWTLDKEALENFWHGVGRSVFFNALLPGTSVFESVRTEAPHELALLNATAGIAWAYILVNIKQPEILLHLVSTQSKLLSSNGAFTNGVISTVLMADDTLPGDPYTAALSAWRPPCACSGLTETWNRLVANPLHTANRDYLPVLRRRHRLADVFRYQDLGLLVQKLEGRI